MSLFTAVYACRRKDKSQSLAVSSMVYSPGWTQCLGMPKRRAVYRGSWKDSWTKNQGEQKRISTSWRSTSDFGNLKFNNPFSKETQAGAFGHFSKWSGGSLCMTIQTPEPMQFWLGVPNTTSILISCVRTSDIGKLGDTCFCCCNIRQRIVDAGLYHGGIYDNPLVLKNGWNRSSVQTFHDWRQID